MTYRTFVTAASLIATGLATPALAQSQGQGQADKTTNRQASKTVGHNAQYPLSADLRRASNQALQATLYDLIALKHAAHQEHWNVVGLEFYQLHEFYSALYTSLSAPIDRTAERIRALGKAADGRPGNVSKTALPKAPPVAKRSARQTLALLEKDWATVSNALYQRIAKTGDDLVTQDLLIGITHRIDKQLWQLRSHLARMDSQNKRSNTGDRDTAKPQAATKNTPQSNNDPDSQTVN